MRKRGIKLCKKGTIAIRQTLIHLGMILLAVVVGLFLFEYVNSLEQNYDFEMLFLSRDIALLTNTIYAGPGNVEYIYSAKKQGLGVFNVDFKALSAIDDKPIVKISHETIPKSYPYAKSSTSKDFFLLQFPKSIKFSKSNEQLAIAKNE